MFGVTRMSGVRGSPFGGSPGALKSCVIPGPEKICADAGDVVRGRRLRLERHATAFAVRADVLFSQSSETSSSVGPMPLALERRFGKGQQPAVRPKSLPATCVIGSPVNVDMP